MEIQLLRDPEVLPSADVLELALQSSYPTFNRLLDLIEAPDFGLTPEWHYYNDGKAWLCKVVYKKKTVFWLSVWESYFKTTFYFTEKNIQGISELPIADEIIAGFLSAKPIGRLIPLTINVKHPDQVDDLLKIIDYKKNLK